MVDLTAIINENSDKEFSPFATDEIKKEQDKLGNVDQNKAIIDRILDPSKSFQEQTSAFNFPIEEQKSSEITPINEPILPVDKIKAFESPLNSDNLVQFPTQPQVFKDPVLGNEQKELSKDNLIPFPKPTLSMDDVVEASNIEPLDTQITDSNELSDVLKPLAPITKSKDVPLEVEEGPKIDLNDPDSLVAIIKDLPKGPLDETISSLEQQFTLLKNSRDELATKKQITEEENKGTLAEIQEITAYTAELGEEVRAQAIDVLQKNIEQAQEEIRILNEALEHENVKKGAYSEKLKDTKVELKKFSDAKEKLSKIISGQNGLSYTEDRSYSKVA